MTLMEYAIARGYAQLKAEANQHPKKGARLAAIVERYRKEGK
jgi:hypothetical protein